MLDLGRETEKKHSVLVGSGQGKLRKAELDRLLAAQIQGHTSCFISSLAVFILVLEVHQGSNTRGLILFAK